MNMKVLIGTLLTIGGGIGVFAFARQFGKIALPTYISTNVADRFPVLSLFISNLAAEKPKTINREWEEAATERAREQKMDPFTVRVVSTTPNSSSCFVTDR
jgi:hypothetical protein